MPRVVEVADIGHDGLAPYLGLRDGHRRETREARLGVFVVEGLTALEQLLASDHEVLSGLVLEARRARVEPGWPEGPPLFVAGREVLDAVAGFPVHRGVLALARRRSPEATATVADLATLVVLEDLNDHENLGAIGRAARALGAGALVLSPRCADPFYRRSIRVSQGHLLRLRLARAAEWPADLRVLRAAGHRVLALTPDPAAVELDRVAVGAEDRVSVLVGAEGSGLTPAARDAADLAVRIPMAPGVDSLNVGHAVAVALHHVDAARRASLRNRYDDRGTASHPPPTMPA